MLPEEGGEHHAYRASFLVLNSLKKHKSKKGPWGHETINGEWTIRLAADGPRNDEPTITQSSVAGTMIGPGVVR